ncbi:lipid IV(A) 3-deoxy-D-manno-octulosonic acid transferase [Salicola sp. Rm-C-2C1-2]|uniref:lipid IV(A) 3-deoxy-D-manno-octulosonic acid transferase n=1 Tax=Salicola sp. Rm-C-2C1-2 TaxID=3141321 RepID=UPI0032E40086
MARWLYSLLLTLLLPGVLAFLWYRGLWDSRYREGWLERLGHGPLAENSGTLWVHAASVGEVIAAAPMIRLLRQKMPERPILVTTMTPTGAERVRAAFGDTVAHAYIPLDLPWLVSRFLRRLKPAALVIMETEVWPNLVQACTRRGISVILANARLSDKSATGYARIAPLTLPAFRSLDWIAAQSDADAQRFRAMGVRSEQLSVTGSIKYDLSIPEAVHNEAMALRRSFSGRQPVWIAASTHEGEDEAVLDAHRPLMARHPEALLVLVPRHPERFDVVARLIEEKGLNMARRAAGDELEEAQVYLADTMGELLMLFGCADAAFIGGSLIERGGHNPLEAAAWSLPVLTGPHVFNFASVFEILEDAAAVHFVENADALAGALATLLADGSTREDQGQRARAVVDANQGAVARLVEGIRLRLARY